MLEFCLLLATIHNNIHLLAPLFMVFLGLELSTKLLLLLVFICLLAVHSILSLANPLGNANFFEY